MNIKSNNTTNTTKKLQRSRALLDKLEKAAISHDYMRQGWNDKYWKMELLMIIDEYYGEI